MNVLNDMLERSFSGYEYNILIYSASPKTHVFHIQGLDRFLQNQTHVKREKFKLDLFTISFLGYIISRAEYSYCCDRIAHNQKQNMIVL